MSGLTAANVETILEKLDDCVDTLEQTHAHNLAANLADLVDEVQQMQRDNTAQARRPDRVGDECWYALWDVDNGRWDWRRGIFRGICDRSYPFVAEDAITKSLELCLHVNFSAEAPK